MTHTALLFPGQGSQENGMGRDLAENDSTIMALWKTAERISGLALREIYWDGDQEAMALTSNLQPALTVTNLAFWTRLSASLHPCCTAGHSLGELSALAAASVLPIDAVLELASLRGRLMSQADPLGQGAMAAIVKVSLETVEQCVVETKEKTGELLVVANYNTPAQYVVSGTKNAIEVMSAAIKEQKGRAVPLAVSGAFHSPLMNEAAAEFAKALDNLGKGAWNNAAFPVYSNATAKGATDRELLKEQLKKQMISTVYWIDTIRNQWNDGARAFAECGPKSVLGKMVGPILKDVAPDGAEPDVFAYNSLESLLA